MATDPDQRKKNTTNKLDYAYRSGYAKQMENIPNLTSGRVPQGGSMMRSNYHTGQSAADQDRDED